MEDGQSFSCSQAVEVQLSIACLRLAFRLLTCYSLNGGNRVPMLDDLLKHTVCR